MIHVKRAPSGRPFPLVYPCPDRNIDCEPCYKPYYKAKTIYLTESLYRRIHDLFAMVATEANVEMK
jgi:hypothetical protein